jgi:hypothetical protein
MGEAVEFRVLCSIGSNPGRCLRSDWIARGVVGVGIEIKAKIETMSPDPTHEVFERLLAVGESGEVQIGRLQFEIDRIERSRLHGLQINLLKTVEFGLGKRIPPIGTKGAVEAAHGIFWLFGIGERGKGGRYQNRGKKAEFHWQA